MAKLSKANMHAEAKRLAAMLLAFKEESIKDPEGYRQHVAAMREIHDLVVSPSRRKVGVLVLLIHYVGPERRSRLITDITDTAVHG